MVKLNAKQLRVREPSEKELTEIQAKRREIYLMLVDVYDTYNVGGLFRLADATGVKKIYLCGRTECPPNPRIFKAAVGTDRWVEWEYCESAEECIERFKIQDSRFKIIGIEQSEKSVGLDEAKLDLPLLLVLGNETEGLSEEVLNLCDQIVEIPMYGVNRSLNVIVAGAMVLGRVM